MTPENKIIAASLAAAVISVFATSPFYPRACAPSTLCRGFRHIDGNTYAYDVIFSDSKTDDGAARTSTLEVYEDGKPLGPPHSDVSDIAQNGGGRYLYWQSSMSIRLYLSASDNSDPNTNGRIYKVFDPAAGAAYRRF